MKLNEWIISGEVGTSSKTIWAVMSGLVNPSSRIEGGYGIPYDPDDFSRCYKIVRDCNLKPRLHEIITAFPAWKPFVDNWEELECMVIEQIETHENNGMYDFMKPLVDESRRLDGWVEKSPGSWSRQTVKFHRPNQTRLSKGEL